MQIHENVIVFDAVTDVVKHFLMNVLAHFIVFHAVTDVEKPFFMNV